MRPQQNFYHRVTEKRDNHKAGFVNIVGLPNAGKSTLTNALIRENLTITNSKPQTTRHRIHAILSDDDYQMVIADTPGYIDNPEYSMQEAMNKAALSVLEDADILLLVHDLTDSQSNSQKLLELIKKKYDGKIFLLLNKSDLCSKEEVLNAILAWKDLHKFEEIVPISASSGRNLSVLQELLIEHLPVHPPYYDKDEISDRSVRFFVSEIIRKKILELYHKEIPYSCDVVVTDYKTNGSSSGKTLISAVIYVMRNSQRQILIGHKGSSIKKLGQNARAEIEDFVQDNVFLDLTVKIRENWRDNEKDLKKLGY